MVGFPLLTIGIITGGLWANHAWGSYWSWDPKESMALVTWLGYAAYIHLRIHRETSEEKLSLVAIAGMMLTLLTYLGFNSLGFGGLHSYGKFKETSSMTPPIKAVVFVNNSQKSHGMFAESNVPTDPKPC
jgi:cytochrome c biogenesis factor